MAPPMVGSVPPPNSSMSNSVRLFACFIMFFMFSRWLEYVDRSSAIDCSSPMSIIIFWNEPTVERSPTGIDKPHCSIYCSSPTVLRHTDLPPAFGPEIISSRPIFFFLSVKSVASVVSNLISSGTTFLSCFASDRCNNGCMARIQSMWGSAFTSGSKACICSAIAALACMRSICARNWYESSTS